MRHHALPPIGQQLARVRTNAKVPGSRLAVGSSPSHRARSPAFAFAGSRYRYSVVKHIHCVSTSKHWLAVLLQLCVMVVRVPFVCCGFLGSCPSPQCCILGASFLCTVPPLHSAMWLSERSLEPFIQLCEDLHIEISRLSKARS